MPTLLDQVTDQLVTTAKIMGVSEDYIRILSKPARTVIVNMPVRMDDGTLRMFKGYKVLHQNSMGPGRGGLRMDPNSTIQCIQALSMINSWSSALSGIPMGGSHGAIIADRYLLSDSERERLIRRYISSIINIIGPERDIISPDLGTGQRTMAWVFDTYSMGVGRTTPSVCTGKPIETGGIVGNEQAIGWGIADVLREVVRRDPEKDLRDDSVVIQGIGHVGKNFARTINQFGAKIIAISDSKTGVYNPNGLDINDVIHFKETHGSLVGYERADAITNEEMLTLPCYALVPCARESQIRGLNVDKLQCELIIEGAHSPVTYKADRILEERGDITVIPDIVANSGGAIIGYFEWVQDISQLRWTASRVSKELERVILNAFDEIYRMKEKNAISYRRAALMVAISKVLKAKTLRGLYP
ncbi:MAG: Glu/Leu/Phe/Val dehydrogenase [Candidatus Lokiarchaeota archaeon]|nr:Glu/Leu/Phe/Val dehydrogenase [Candidatus Lokiarchaeota archaeon]